MANATGAFGLRPVRYMNGAAWTGQVRAYFVTDANALFVGDPVVSAGSANSAEQQGFPPGTLQTITIATAGTSNRILGVVVGFMADTRDSPVYRAANTDRVAFIADDPDLVFEIRDDGAAALGAGHVGLNANLVAGAGGSTTFGHSSWALDTNSNPPAADAADQVTILGLSKRIDNELAAYAVWDVFINLHARRAGVAGVA